MCKGTCGVERSGGLTNATGSCGVVGRSGVPHHATAHAVEEKRCAPSSTGSDGVGPINKQRLLRVKQGGSFHHALSLGGGEEIWA